MLGKDRRMSSIQNRLDVTRLESLFLINAIFFAPGNLRYVLGEANKSAMRLAMTSVLKKTRTVDECIDAVSDVDTFGFVFVSDKETATAFERESRRGGVNTERVRSLNDALVV